MNRYFLDGEEQDNGSPAEVFNITKSETNRAINDRNVVNREKKRRFQREEYQEGGLYGKKRLGKDKYPGKAPVDPEALERHKRSDGVNAKRLKSKFAQKMSEKREKDRQRAHELAARTEILLQDEAGFIEPDSDDEFTGRVTQTQIKRSVDAESAEKGFDLNMPQFGPYTVDYTRNGKFLLLGGRKGHVAAIDWTEKKLKCEVNVQESVHDVKWLHTENMFAVAQKKWTYIYDNQGIELHCLKQLDNVLRMEFLPYHFLLATSVSFVSCSACAFVSIISYIARALLFTKVVT
jgi:U3 small nucleolar RNA-associated protein 7